MTPNNYLTLRTGHCSHHRQRISQRSESVVREPPSSPRPIQDLHWTPLVLESQGARPPWEDPGPGTPDCSRNQRSWAGRRARGPGHRYRSGGGAALRSSCSPRAPRGPARRPTRRPARRAHLGTGRLPLGPALRHRLLTGAASHGRIGSRGDGRPPPGTRETARGKAAPASRSPRLTQRALRMRGGSAAPPAGQEESAHVSNAVQVKGRGTARHTKLPDKTVKKRKHLGQAWWLITVISAQQDDHSLVPG